jgi:hypothetical protein
MNYDSLKDAKTKRKTNRSVRMMLFHKADGCGRLEKASRSQWFNVVAVMTTGEANRVRGSVRLSFGLIVGTILSTLFKIRSVRPSSKHQQNQLRKFSDRETRTGAKLVA